MVGNHHVSTTPKTKEIWHKLRYSANITIFKEYLERERERERERLKSVLTQFFSRSMIWSILRRKSFPLGGVISSSFFTRSLHDFISSFWNQQGNIINANVNMLKYCTHIGTHLKMSTLIYNSEIYVRIVQKAGCWCTQAELFLFLFLLDSGTSFLDK